MDTIDVLVETLRDRDNRRAHAALCELQAISEHSAAVYPYFDTFAAMLDDSSSYMRIRGLWLIAANARWDTDRRLDGVIAAYLTYITDQKPIASRQCIRALPLIARARPDLKACIRKALLSADTSPYADSMRPLVEKDIAAAVAALK